MAHRFKIGDRVRVVDGPRKGQITTVIGEGFAGWSDLLEEFGVAHRFAYELDIPPIPGYNSVLALPEWLRPYYDGNERGEWTEELRRICRVGEDA